MLIDTPTLHSDIPPFWTKLNVVCRYPAQSEPLQVIGIGAVLSWLVAYFPMLAPLRIFLDLAVISYVYKYGAEVLLHTARGNVEQAPEFVTSVDDDQGWQQIWLFVGMYALGRVAFFICLTRLRSRWVRFYCWGIRRRRSWWLLKARLSVH